MKASSNCNVDSLANVACALFIRGTLLTLKPGVIHTFLSNQLCVKAYCHTQTNQLNLRWNRVNGETEIHLVGVLT